MDRYEKEILLVRIHSHPKDRPTDKETGLCRICGVGEMIELLIHTNNDRKVLPFNKTAQIIRAVLLF
jgi:hypothetical protein